HRGERGADRQGGEEKRAPCAEGFHAVHHRPTTRAVKAQPAEGRDRFHCAEQPFRDMIRPPVETQSYENLWRFMARGFTRLAQFPVWICLLAAGLAVAAIAEEWPQFRGPNGTGISTSADVPVEFGPDRGVTWKSRVPAGKSSPVLSSRRIYLTGYEGNLRLVVCLDRATGAEVWRRSLPAARSEKPNR